MQSMVLFLQAALNDRNVTTLAHWEKAHLPNACSAADDFRRWTENEQEDIRFLFAQNDLRFFLSFDRRRTIMSQTHNDIWDESLWDQIRVWFYVVGKNDSDEYVLLNLKEIKLTPFWEEVTHVQ